MLKSLSVAFMAIGLFSCASSNEQMFLNMSENELTQYNASVPATQQIECREGVRRGTVGLVRKVCTSKSRMARLTGPSRSASASEAFNQGFYGNRTYFDDRSVLPRVYFSSPPPGYSQPVIHVLDSPSRQ